MPEIPIFRPPWWAPGPHAQTLGARFLRPKGIVPLRRERWDTPDGDFLDLDFVDADRLTRPSHQWSTAVRNTLRSSIFSGFRSINVPSSTLHSLNLRKRRISQRLPHLATKTGETGGLRDDRLVVVLHGLEGSARSGYAFRLYRQLAQRGIAAVGLNFRSCSGEINRGLRLYHSGETEDLRWVLARLAKRFPRQRLSAVGISLGGNVLLKYLGESGNGSGLECAAAWSIPFDLSAGADFMETGFAQFYVRRLLHSLKRKVRVRSEELAPLIDFERTLRSQTFREFDDAATAPLHGFDGAADYYARSSSAGFLDAIRTPTLVLHSKDDPFLPAEAIPVKALNANSMITPVITQRGGHVGFITGSSPVRPYFWAETVIADWIARVGVGPID